MTAEPENRLIIGCGYLGRRVARLWLERGHRVVVTTRRVESLAELREFGVVPVVCDVLTPETLCHLPPMTTVLYAVGFDRTSGTTMRDVYVDGLSRVLDALAPPQRFIHVSSTSVYGQANGELVDETSPTEPEEDSGRIVLDAECVLREKLPAAIVLRFAGIYGPGRLLRQQAITAGEIIRADPERWLNLIHVEDGAAAVLAAERFGVPGGVYNVSDDLPIRRREFYEALAQELAAPPPRFETPGPGPLPPHERANRRIVSLRLREELHFTCRYPTYREGLAASLPTKGAHDG